MTRISKPNPTKPQAAPARAAIKKEARPLTAVEVAAARVAGAKLFSRLMQGVADLDPPPVLRALITGGSQDPAREELAECLLAVMRFAHKRGQMRVWCAERVVEAQVRQAELLAHEQAMQQQRTARAVAARRARQGGAA